MKYTQNDIDTIVELYKSGLSCTKIADITPYSSSSVSRYIKELGLARKTKRTPQEVERFQSKIRKLYLSGKYEREIAEQLNVKEGVVNYHVHKMGIARHKGPTSKIQKEDYFDLIDNQRKAYWLGWIMADGNVSIYNGQYSLKLKVQYDDRLLIEEFLKDIGANYDIYDYMARSPQGKLKKASYVSLTSVHMVKSLIDYGVIPRKTGFEKFPVQLSNELKAHFLRGFFDAEGHVSFRREFRHSYYSVGFSTNEKMCMSIIDFTGLQTSIVQKEGACQISYGKKQAKQLFKILYEDANFYLPRKHDKFVELLNA